MSGIKNYLIDIFNLGKKKQPYSAGQVLGIFGIVLFLFPVIFNIFGYLSIPFAYMIEFMFEPKNFHSARYAMLAVMIIRFLMGMAAGIWICKMVWPKRKPRAAETGSAEGGASR